MSRKTWKTVTICKIYPKNLALNKLRANNKNWDFLGIRDYKIIMIKKKTAIELHLMFLWNREKSKVTKKNL